MKKNFLLQRMRYTNRALRIALAAIALAAAIALIPASFSMGQIPYALPPWPAFIVIPLLIWALVNAAFIIVISFFKKLELSTGCLLVNLISIISLSGLFAVLGVIIFANWFSVHVIGLPDSLDGLVGVYAFGSPGEWEDTFYLRQTGGDLWNGRDVDVMLVRGDDKEHEIRVCHLEKTNKVEIEKIQANVFSINGNKYIIENGRASPLGE